MGFLDSQKWGLSGKDDKPPKGEGAARIEKIERQLKAQGWPDTEAKDFIKAITSRADGQRETDGPNEGEGDKPLLCRCGQPGRIQTGFADLPWICGFTCGEWDLEHDRYTGDAPDADAQ